MSPLADGRDGLALDPILPHQFDGPSVREIMEAVPGNGRWDVDETIMRIGDDPLEQSR